jgi:hypothetical protein
MFAMVGALLVIAGFGLLWGWKIAVLVAGLFALLASLITATGIEKKEEDERRHQAMTNPPDPPPALPPKG